MAAKTNSSTVHWTPSTSVLSTGSGNGEPETTASSTVVKPEAAAGVLRFVPTVNRVNLPVPPPPSMPSSMAAEAAAADVTPEATPEAPPDADVDAGVSEFLPCADFMGPGVSPPPCFSLSDSPLGSLINSSTG